MVQPFTPKLFKNMAKQPKTSPLTNGPCQETEAWHCWLHFLIKRYATLDSLSLQVSGGTDISVSSHHTCSMHQIRIQEWIWSIANDIAHKLEPLNIAQGSFSSTWSSSAPVCSSSPLAVGRSSPPSGAPRHPPFLVTDAVYSVQVAVAALQMCMSSATTAALRIYVVFASTVCTCSIVLQPTIYMYHTYKIFFVCVNLYYTCIVQFRWL